MSQQYESVTKGARRPACVDATSSNARESRTLLLATPPASQWQRSSSVYTWLIHSFIMNYRTSVSAANDTVSRETCTDEVSAIEAL